MLPLHPYACSCPPPKVRDTQSSVGGSPITSCLPTPPASRSGCVREFGYWLGMPLFPAVGPLTCSCGMTWMVCVHRAFDGSKPCPDHLSMDQIHRDFSFTSDVEAGPITRPWLIWGHSRDTTHLLHITGKAGPGHRALLRVSQGLATATQKLSDH